MNIILAGIPGGGWERREKSIQLLHPNRLWSYYHAKEENKVMKKENKVDLFLDSGAFSAWTQKVEINIEDYISFIKKHEELFTVYANLDVIGDPVRTYQNQKTMEKAGLHPIPVFHPTREPTKWLKFYLKKKYKYIALGGMAGSKNVSQKTLIPVLDDLWKNYLTDSQGIPVCKVHGFGLTSLKLMTRYPWYSVDSTSWLVTGRVGSIHVPRKRNGEYIYNENSWKIAVSNKSPSRRDVGQHFDSMNPLQQKMVLDYLKHKGYKMGKSSFKLVSQEYTLQENEKWVDKKPKDKTTKRKVEIIEEVGVSNSYVLRDEMNIIYFQDLEKTMQKWPWPFKIKSQKTLFT